jgi:hypothetical protein
MRRETAIRLLAGLMLAVTTATASRAESESGQQAGLRFWKYLSGGDLAKAEGLYTPEVTLLAGSELLKAEWGINPGGERGKDLVLKREDLLKGYRAMVAKIGAEKWKAAFAKIDEDKIGFRSIEKEEEGFKGTKKGDVLMKIATGPGDDALSFVLRRSADGNWRVAMEQTDY